MSLEARSDLAREHEVVALEESDEQRAKSDASALAVRESADDELFGQLALHLEPVLRSLVLIRRVEPLRDDAFPTLGARFLPRRSITQLGDATDWLRERECRKKCASLGQRQMRNAPPVDPYDVEDMVGAVPVPFDFAVENTFVDRQGRDSRRDVWEKFLILRSRKEAN